MLKLPTPKAKYVFRISFKKVYQALTEILVAKYSDTTRAQFFQFAKRKKVNKYPSKHMEKYV